ncbi:MAG: DNA repair protein RecN [Spartobacteria bacterium]
MSATLASLRIRNLALVENLLWEPPSGFVAITGETGAGKSIILGAVKLLLGERAEKSLVRSGADACAVEGLFQIPADSRVHATLEEGGAEACEDGALVIKRTVSTAGAGKQFVNGSPCTLALLRQLGDLLVDLHGPHDHQSLFSRDQQMLVLDSFAGAEALRTGYGARRREWMQLTAEKKRLTENAEALARELDLLTHQVAEIDEAALQPGEEDQLLARQRTGANAHRLCSICADLTGLLSESEDSLTSRWGDVSRLMRELQRLDAQAEPMVGAAAGIFESLQDLARDVDRYASALDADPKTLEATESRLDTIQNLKRKYGSTVEAVIAFGTEASAKLAQLKNREERGAGLDDEISAAKKALDSTAKQLGQARRKAAPKLADLVKTHLADLGFAKAGFSIVFEELEDASPLGIEQVDFLFAPNPGEPERPLRAIASSGEISRVMLALKTSLAAQDSVPVLIFDEIDANVGGEIGAKVGAKMKELAASHQVFCITHLPQVAAAATAQFMVSKDTSGERTRTSLVSTDGADRVTEIARMLGGQAESARKHAKALLSGK